MANLKDKALDQAIKELQEAENLLIVNSGAPDFGTPVRTDTKAGEIMRKISDARQWIAAVRGA